MGILRLSSRRRIHLSIVGRRSVVQRLHHGTASHNQEWPLSTYNDAMTSTSMTETTAVDRPVAVNEARLWIDKGWTARVIKNEDDEGWAVEMILDGEPEPALVGPWTMGRDKKNPKPLDAAAFGTLVKTASEVLRRHEQHLYAMHHKRISVSMDAGQVEVTLDIVADEDDPYALLGAQDASGGLLAQVRVGPEFKFNLGSARAWIEDEYRKPGS